MDKNHPNETTGSVNASEKGAASGKKWSLKKKLALGAIALIVVLGLGLGLGLGLTLGRDNDDDDDDQDNDNDNNDNDDGGDSSPSAIWHPEVAAPWQISLIKTMVLSDGLIDGVDIYDLDLFDNSRATFKAMHDADKKVICYFSAGSYEDWRDDADDFDEDDLGEPLDGWPGERWLRLDSDNVRNIMKKRIKYAADKGCDAIDPDNVDGFQNDNGLDLTADDSISFMKFLSTEAHALNLSIGLKNAGDIIPDVLSDMDFSVNEQCIEYAECETFAPFIDDGKPVFNIEYPTKKSLNKEICSGKGKADGTEGFSIVIKKMDLDYTVEYCDGKTFD